MHAKKICTTYKVLVASILIVNYWKSQNNGNKVENYQYCMFSSLNNLSQKHCNIILKVLTNPRRYLTGAGTLKAVSL